jgi:hypothetical protein
VCVCFHVHNVLFLSSCYTMCAGSVRLLAACSTEHISRRILCLILTQQHRRGDTRKKRERREEKKGKRRKHIDERR